MANEPERLADLLHLPLEDGIAGRLIVFNAPAQYRLPTGFAGEATLVQPFRPRFLTLQSAGLPVSAETEERGFDVALVALGRHRGENENMLADAAGRLKDGGLLVTAGFKPDGAASLRKRLAGRISGMEHASKHHGVVFWFEVDHAVRDVLQEAVVAGTVAHPPLACRPSPPQGGRLGAASTQLISPLEGEMAGRPEEGERRSRQTSPEGFVTAPGMFSHDRVDPASRLLVEALPEGLKGRIADFGAGWGYLAVSLAQRFGDVISRIDLYEADFHAIEAARANMAAHASATPAEFFWHDIRREPIAARYDAVVMNPPFHESRAADPAIGADFIRAAHASLKPGGRLFLVANRGLPYETVLSDRFAASGEIVRDERYKVLWAKR